MEKIHAFIFDLGKGGAQGVFVTVVNFLIDKGYEVEVIVQTLANEIHLKELRPEAIIKDLGVESAKKQLPKLIGYIKKNSVKCAVAFSPEIAVNLYIAKRICNKRDMTIIGRSINTLSVEFKYTQSFFRKQVTCRLIKWFYKRIDRVIAQSKGMAEDLVINLHISEGKVIVINNPLGKKFEAELPRACQKDRDDYILYAGRLEPQKGLPMLLKAFSQMKHKSVKLYIIGSGSLKDELVKQAIELHISGKVTFIEYTDDIISYYRHAKVTVLSSLYEGFPNVLTESLACGTPIVSFDMPSGANEIVRSENGILVDYLDVDGLSQAMDIALNTKWDYEMIKKSAIPYLEERVMLQYLKCFER